MSKFFCLSLTLIVMGLLSPAASAQKTWPQGKAGCLENHTEYTHNCTLAQKLGIRNMETGGLTVVHKHGMNGGKKVKKSHIKKIMKLQGVKNSKDKDWEYLLYKPSSANFFGLRKPDGTVLLKTAYREVYPLSETHSVVKLKDSTLKLAEHGSHKLTEIPTNGQKLFGATLTTHDTDIEITQFWAGKFYEAPTGSVDPRGGVGDLSPLLPSGQFGAPIKNVNGHMGNTIPSMSTGTAAYQGSFYLYVKDLETKQTSTKQFDPFLHPLSQNIELKSFSVDYGQQSNARNPWSWSHVTPIAEAPSGIGLRDAQLYWPVNPTGGMAPRVDGVVGVIPVLKKFSADKDYQAWLIVLKANDGFDYMLGTMKNNSKADEIIKFRNRFQRLDDVYLSSDGKDIAIKPMSKNGVPAKWYGVLGKDILRASYQYVAIDNKREFDPRHGSTSPGAAIGETAQSRQNWQRRQDEQAAAKRRRKAAARAAAWSSPSRAAADCHAEYGNIQSMMSGSSSKKATDADVRWALQYEKNKRKPCNQWPSNRNPPLNMNAANPYTLEKGLQDIAKAASCSYQKQQCVNDGQYQRCRMVTVTTC